MTVPRHSCVLALLIVALTASVFAHDPIRIEAETSDGVKILGDYWTPIHGEKAPVAILLHMYRSDRTAWGRDMIVALEMAGFAIARIDLRGHGESVDPSRSLAKRVASRDPELFNAMDRDVEAVVQWLSHRPEADTSRIVLLGASVGCSVALDYARGNSAVKALALMSPGTRYLGVDSLQHLKEYGARPVMMLTSREEQSRGFDQLVQVARESGAQLETHVFDQSGIHGTRMLGQVKDVEQQIVDFLKKHAG